MIYLADIRNWLKGFNIADYYYSGKLDANKEKAICVNPYVQKVVVSLYIKQLYNYIYKQEISLPY